VLFVPHVSESGAPLVRFHRRYQTLAAQA
jgi:hypothetical protein